MPAPSRSPHLPLRPKSVAVDITTGYGADSYLGQIPGKDPWGRECFMSIIDAAVNHREFYYPLPTAASTEAVEDEKFPSVMASLQKAGVLIPVARETAEELPVSDEGLKNEYENFHRWAQTHGEVLRKWLVLFRGKHVKSQHLKRVRTDVAPFVEAFWARNCEGEQKVKALARGIGVKRSHLCFAFDEMVRGLQYSLILALNGITYFPHPIRYPLLSGEIAIRHHEYAAQWSWGRLLAGLVETGRMRKEPDEISQVVASLRARVGSKKATWYQLASEPEEERRRVVEAIAGDSALPAKVKNEVRRWIGIGSTAAATGTGLFLHDPVVSIALFAIKLPINYWQGEVPGAVGRIPFLRGLLEWPGLFGPS